MADTTFIDQQTVVYADWLQDVNNHVYRSTTVNSINSKTGPVALLGGANVTIDNSVAGQVTISATGGGGGGVTNVNGKTGAVTLAAGTNVTLDTSGANIVINATGGGGGGVTSFNTRTGVVSLTGADVTGALGFTPYNATNPSGYLTGITSSNVTGALGYTPVNPTRLVSAGTGLTGGGDLTNDRTLSVVADTTQQKVGVQKNGTAVATRANLNFIEGANTTLTIADNGPSNRLDITVASTGGGGGVSSFNSRTGAVSLTSTDVTNAIGFTPYNATNPSGYVAAASSPTFTGRVFGNGGGSGLGQITLTTTAGTPTGGSVGDIKLVY